MESHVKIFEEESFIGYFHVFRDIQGPKACDIHNVFFYSNRSPLVLTVGMKGTKGLEAGELPKDKVSFVIDAHFSPIQYTEKEFKDDKGNVTKKSVRSKNHVFNKIDIVYPIDELDKLVLDAN